MGTQPFDHQRNAGIGIQINQIIKFAVCVDNKDPQRAGRIRAVGTKGEGLTQSKIADPLKFIIGEDNKALKEKSYVPWGIDDPYTFAPF